jgi:hypothetical protein
MAATPRLPSVLDRPAAVLRLSLAASTAFGDSGPEFRPLSQVLDGGLPARIALDGGRTLILAIAVGQARRWMADDPSVIAVDLPPRAATGSAELRGLDTPVARLTLVAGGRIGDSVPVIAGRQAILASDGVGSVEVVLDRLVVSVGSLRSPGLYGSEIRLRWRPLDVAPPDGPAQVDLDPTIPRVPEPQLKGRAAAFRRSHR